MASNTRDADRNEADSKLAAGASARAPMVESGDFKFSRSVARFWQEGKRHYGAWRTLREFASSFWRAIIELTPSRRQARYGDLDYDLEHSVNTTRANVSFRTQWMATLAGSPYYASDPWLFEEIMQALAAPHVKIPFEKFTFIDMGSGKGRALLLAAAYPLRRIIGVELIPALHQACLQNVETASQARPDGPPIEAFCMDARDFQFPPEPLVVYMFNPFPEPVFAAVLSHLRQSVLENPRPVYVAYRYIEHEQLLAASNWLTKVAGTEQWAIYRNLVRGA